MQIQQAIVILENLRVQQSSASITKALTMGIQALIKLQNKKERSK